MSEWLALLLSIYAGTCGYVAGWRIRDRILDEGQIRPATDTTRNRNGSQIASYGPR